MTNFARLTAAATLLAAWGWVVAAPPRVTGNRPVVIDAPILETDDAPGNAPRAVARAIADDPADGPARTEPARPRSAASELKRAREQLLKYTTIQARLVETASIFDKAFKAEGRYLQTALKSDDWHMRLELALKVGESEGSLLEVCDGDVLWTSSQIDTGRKTSKKEKKELTITRRNVNQILAAARKLGEEVESSTVVGLGLGGLPGLLASLERDMKFSGVKEEALRNRPVLVLRGVWSEEFGSRFTNPQQEGAQAMYPPFVPDSVRIFLDRETGFPLRLQYRKKMPNRDVERDMLTLDFLEVALNQPIDNSEFSYDPPTGVQPHELTTFYLDQLAPPEMRAAPGSGRK